MKILKWIGKVILWYVEFLVFTVFWSAVLYVGSGISGIMSILTVICINVSLFAIKKKRENK